MPFRSTGYTYNQSEQRSMLFVENKFNLSALLWRGWLRYCWSSVTVIICDNSIYQTVPKAVVTMTTCWEWNLKGLKVTGSTHPLWGIVFILHQGFGFVRTLEFFYTEPEPYACTTQVDIMTPPLITGRCSRKWTVQCSRLRESENATCEQKKCCLAVLSVKRRRFKSSYMFNLQCRFVSWWQGPLTIQNISALLKHLDMKHLKEIWEI